MTIDVLKTLPNSKLVSNNSVPIRRSVRRSLFGDVDHEESMAFLKKELDAIAESQKNRWNFDFANESPLESCEYEWTAVKPDEIVPKPYALSRLPYLYEHSENAPCNADQSLLPAQSQPRSKVTISKTKLKQTLIDGFVNSRKRTVSISSTESCQSCKTTSDCIEPTSKKLRNTQN